MAKRGLEEKQARREAREAQKARASEERREFRQATGSCGTCGGLLEPYEVTVVSSGRKVAMDMCPRCYEDGR